MGLTPGSVVGNRFEIERAVDEDALGSLLRARDQKTSRPIAVRVFGPGLIATQEALEHLRSYVKIASGVQHKSIVGTYGMGNDKLGGRFVAMEWVDGQSLTEVVAEKQAKGQPMSLRGVLNVLSHVAEALEAARAKGMVHGALRPSTVFVTSGGRVKVSNLGIDRAVVETAGPAALGDAEQAYLAPEVKAGGSPDARSDVFGIGSLLYAMLTGRSAADPFVAPSKAHPEATAALDDVLLRCLSADPAARFAHAAEVKQALVALTIDTEVSHDTEDFGVDLDVDVDVGSVRPPPKSRPAPAPSIPRTSHAPPAVGQRIGVDQSFRLDVADFANAPGPAPAMSAEVDLSDLLAKITENDAPRWMVVKDNLDHGPFSGRELVTLILKGEVLGDHGLLNMDTGERKKVKEAPDFTEFVEQWKLKKARADHEVALERSAKVETRSTLTKAMILGGVATLVAALIGIFVATRPEVEETELTGAETVDLYERGEIEITGTSGILEDPPPRRGGRRGRRTAGGASSYEDAMNQVVNLGDVSAGGGSMSRLTPQQVSGVMNQNINRLVPCLASGSGGGQVRIDMAIAGTGEVLGATVRNGTPAFQQCVAGRVRQVRFPHFNAPRMGASYTFSAG